MPNEIRAYSASQVISDDTLRAQEQAFDDSVSYPEVLFRERQLKKKLLGVDQTGGDNDIR